MLNKISFLLPADIQRQVDAEAANWNADGTIDRIWKKDASVWTGDDETKWLGWLDIVGEELNDIEKYAELHRDIETAGFTDVLLMGMGGSSLGPEVLARTFGKAHFRILDSTVPAQVKAVEDELDLAKTLFIVASKSGSTLEPNCFKQYFFDRLSQQVGAEKAGRQFIAITDPGSKMEKIARDDGFRHIFYGKPEIGGRFSALSAFGMTAAASMGIDVAVFLRSAEEMVEACRNGNASENPGATLGLLLGTCHSLGRDKLTIFASPEIADLGAWLEQLIAESTGKNGVAIIPVDKEPVLGSAFRRPSVADLPPEGEMQNYSNDRVFVFVSLKGNSDLAIETAAISAAGHPVIQIELDDTGSLGQEFFRWEFATAVAGSVMKINPFNQPDVEAAKIEARKITDEYEQSGSLPDEAPFYSDNRFSLFTSDSYAKTLSKTAENKGLTDLLRAHNEQLTKGDYFALLAYIKMDVENEKLLTAIREKVVLRTGNATCLGFGPRFLHSTGQAYKGGPDTGVFLQITSDDKADLPVPGQKFTFGVVKAAQARGDFQVLLDRGRRALRIHIHGDVAEGLKRILDIF